MLDLSRLNKQQRIAVETINGALLLLAGAGTGKTTVVTYRIAYMLENGIEPDQILALTFTNKAAAEMKERVIALVGEQSGKLVTVGTFHSFCLSVLKKYITYLGYDRNFSIADEQLQTRILKQVLASEEIADEEFKLNPGIVRHYIGEQKQQLVYVDGVDEMSLDGRSYMLFKAWSMYQDMLRDQCLIDFDDLIVLTIRLFWDHPDVLEHYQERFQYLMVDEYQDTNLAQLELTRLVAGKRQNICAVGDDDQSIYGWRGADITNILEFESHFKDCKVILIEENYRCSGKILAGANEVIANNSQRHAKSLKANSLSGDDITVVRFDTEHQEAEMFAQKVKDLQVSEQIPFDDFSVLFRSNSQSRALEIAFKRYSIPYKIVGSTSFYSRVEIQDAIAYLKVLANPRDDMSLLRILNVPPRGIGSKSIDKLRTLRDETKLPMSKLLNDDRFLSQLSNKAAENCREFSQIYRKYYQILMVDKAELMPSARQFINEIGYLPGLMKIYKKRKEAEMRLDNVQEFFNDVADFVDKQRKKGEQSLLREYLLRFMLNDDGDKMSGEGVSMLTVHSSKGLEFENVFLVGLEDDLFPHAQSVGEGNLEEERRLFYVAMTRAKKRLFIGWSRKRKVYGKDERRRRSLFVNEIPEALVTEIKPDKLVGKATDEDIDSMLAAFFNED